MKELNRIILKIFMIPTMYKDNKAAIKIAKNEDSNTSKYVVNLGYHYINEVQSGKEEFKIRIYSRRTSNR